MLSFEQEAVILLSKPTLSENEADRLRSLLTGHMDWGKVVGILHIHRLMGIAYKNVRKYVLLNGNEKAALPKIYRQMELIHNIQCVKAQEQILHTLELCKKLTENGIKYVLLKGAVLSEHAYKDLGARDFNDNDILVERECLSSALDIVKKMGYVHGEINLQTREIEEATRRDIVVRTMVSHEVIPLSKTLMNTSYLHSHEVDIQFSIDLMSSNRTDHLVYKMLSERIETKVGNGTIYSLCWEDLLVFISIHYFKEATTENDVMKYKDLLLYKLSDIAHTIENLPINWDKFIIRVLEMKSERAVYYALYHCQEIYRMNIPPHILKALKVEDLDYLDYVYAYDSNRIVHIWQDTLSERIFDMNRPKRIAEKLRTTT